MQASPAQNIQVSLGVSAPEIQGEHLFETVKESRRRIMAALRNARKKTNQGNEAGAESSVKGGSVAESLKKEFSDIADVSNLSVPGFEGQEVIRIKVKNKEKWAQEEEMRKLSKTFGEVVFYAYKDREDKTRYQADDPDFVEQAFQDNMIGTDISLSDDIIAVAKDGKLTGFISFSGYTLENGEKADKLMLTAVHPNQEGKSDLSKKLYETAFQNMESDYLIGSSHTPSAIKNRISIAEQNGWQTYYCGRKNGDSEALMTEREKELLEMAEKAYKQECLEDPDLEAFQEGLPPHYISYGNLGIPPRRLEELKFSKNDAALDQTMRELINYQQKERPDHTLYGLLISIRKSRLKEDEASRGGHIQ